MSIKYVCEVLAQNTPQIIYHSMLKEQKHALFVYITLNANELLLPTTFPEQGCSFTTPASHSLPIQNISLVTIIISIMFFDIM